MLWDTQFLFEKKKDREIFFLTSNIFLASLNSISCFILSENACIRKFIHMFIRLVENNQDWILQNFEFPYFCQNYESNS